MSSNELKSILNDYNQFTNECLKELASSSKEEQKAIEDISCDGKETIRTLESVLQHLRQYSSTTQSVASFKGLKEELEKILKERQRSLDIALDLKQDKKIAIASINKETEQINNDIQRLSDDNDRIAEILRSETSSLVCRLMKGSGQ